MSYDYQSQRPYVFTEEGQVQLLAVIKKARDCIEVAGAVRCDKLTGIARCADSWKQMALVDRLVELKMLRQVRDPDKFTQHQIYVEGSVPL